MIYVAFKIKISGRNRVRISTLKKNNNNQKLGLLKEKNKINQYLHGIRSEPQRSIKHQTSSIWSINLNNEVCTMNVTECQEVCRWIAKRTIKSNRIASIETSEAEIFKGGIEKVYLEGVVFRRLCMYSVYIVQRTFCTRSTTACWLKCQNYHVFGCVRCSVCVLLVQLLPRVHIVLWNSTRYFCRHATH